MRFTFVPDRARLGAAIVFAFAGSVLAACSGGGGGSSLPQVTQPAAPSAPSTSNNNQLVTVNVDQSTVNSLPSFSAFAFHVMPVNQSGTVRKPMSTVFPVDMQFHGGHVLATAQNHEVFINTTAATVGNPQTFQANFSNSTFAHVLDQYAGSTASNRYPVNATLISASLSTFSHVISVNQLLTVLHSAAALTHLTGYGHIYNLFLKPGLDTCMDFGPCYSPDNTSTFVFCAYHGSVTFSDVGHVLFSVMPYQHTPGCGDDFPGLTLPNPVPIDDTATTLSHEESETISDPDPGGGYFNNNFGFEIGDVCATYRANESLNSHTYLIQPEYSNAAHGCFF
jgi:hypothetical protein